MELINRSIISFDSALNCFFAMENHSLRFFFHNRPSIALPLPQINDLFVNLTGKWLCILLIASKIREKISRPVRCTGG